MRLRGTVAKEVMSMENPKACYGVLLRFWMCYKLCYMIPRSLLRGASLSRFQKYGLL